MKSIIGKTCGAVLSACLIMSWNSGFCDALMDYRDTRQETLVGEYYHLLESLHASLDSQKILALEKFIKSNPKFDPTYHKLLELYLRQNKIQDAESYFQKLAFVPNFERNSYWMLAKISTIKDDHKTALDAYKRALDYDLPSPALLKDFAAFVQRLGNKPGDQTLLVDLNIGRQDRVVYSFFVHFLNQDDDEAIKEFLRLSRTLQNDLLIKQILSEVYLFVGRSSESVSMLLDGLKTTDRTGDLVNKVLFLRVLGYSCYLGRKYDDALLYYERALTIANRIDDWYLQELIIGYIGHVNNLRGAYPEAIEKYHEAEEKAKIIGDDQSCRIWLRSRAELLLITKRYNESLRAYNDCEKIITKLNNKAAMLDLKLRLASFYEYLEQTELNVWILKEADQLAHYLNQPDKQALIKARLANLDLKAGKYAQARRAYRNYIRFLTIPTTLRSKAFWLAKIAEAYKLEGLYKEAKEAYLIALETAQQAESKDYKAWYQLDLAEIDVLLNNYQDALKIYRFVLASEVVKDDKELQLTAYQGFGNTYKRIGNYALAIFNYKRAANIAEKLREEINAEQLRIGYFSKSQQVYRSLVECYIQRHEESLSPTVIDSILYFYGKTRSRTLQDLYDAPPDDNIKPKTSLEYQQTCMQLRSLERRRCSENENGIKSKEELELNAELVATKYTLIEQRIRLDQDSSQSTKAVHDSTIQSSAAFFTRLKKTHTGLLLYYISEDIAFVLATNGNEFKVVSLSTNQLLITAAVDSLLIPLHAVNINSLRNAPFRAAVAYRLYKELVKPVEDSLALPLRLVVTADFALMNLPFEMLLTKPPQAPEYTPMDSPAYATDFLLYRYEIAYIPSTTLLQDKSATSFFTPKVLAFANPYGCSRFDPLIYAMAEADGIKKIHPNTQIYHTRDATKIRFIEEAPKYDILHLATHAFVDTTFEAFSGLVLATTQGSTDDGMLMGFEVSDLRLPCDLVTLSACETGRGKLIVGEGILGLPRLFIRAGAKTVLMSLWKVEDKFTSHLMPKFYDFLLNQRLSKSAALTKAKRLLVQESQSDKGFHYQHPFYWASFVLYGDPDISRGGLYSISKIIFAIVAILILMVTTVFYRQSRLKHQSS